MDLDFGVYKDLDTRAATGFLKFSDVSPFLKIIFNYFLRLMLN
jgi:hypothetical protein